MPKRPALNKYPTAAEAWAGKRLESTIKNREAERPPHGVSVVLKAAQAFCAPEEPFL